MKTNNLYNLCARFQAASITQHGTTMSEPVKNFAFLHLMVMDFQTFQQTARVFIRFFACKSSVSIDSSKVQPHFLALNSLHLPHKDQGEAKLPRPDKHREKLYQEVNREACIVDSSLKQ